MDLSSVYKGKKVLITGHTGFKGAWLLQWLNLLGSEVCGYALAPKESNSLFNLIDGSNICQSVIGDIRDARKLNWVVKQFQPDYIFHLAAQALVLDSYEDPIDTYETNVIGTGNVILSIREIEKPCNVIIITTDKVYHNNEWEYPYRENDRLGGYDPYSSSKACTEIIADSFINSFFNKADFHNHQKQIVTARAGNVIGGGDWAENRIVPDIIRATLNEEKVSLRNPTAVRPWQHVLEPLSGYLHLGMYLAKKPNEFLGAWNFGPENKQFLTVEDLTKTCIDLIGYGNYEIEDTGDKKHEANMLQLDISKAKNKLNWHPRLSDQQTFEFTIQWYQEYVNNSQGIKEFTEKQIVEFSKIGM